MMLKRQIAKEQLEMEEKNMARVELNEQNLEDVVGGAFNWYKERGTNFRRCRVDGVGDYLIKDTAKSRYAALKLEHKNDGWRDADYAHQLLSEGEFYN